MAKPVLLLHVMLLLAALVVAPQAMAKQGQSEQFFQGALIVGKTAPENTVTLNGKALKVSKSGDYALGFSRDEKNNSRLVITRPDGTSETKVLKPLKREYKIQRVEGIAKKIMNPDPAALKRVRQDNKKIKAAREIDSDLTAFAGGFIPPIDGVITGVYGSQRYYNGVPKTPHYGLDYAGKTGDPVQAPADGVVLMYEPDMFYSGGTMIIDHGHGVSSTFLHLSAAYVKVGDQVKQGQLVAAVGASGRATGPHLDWRINWFNTRLDPALVLKLKPIQ
ncbi:Murein DD-endopeptidase MepM and murein hydrolase activator NlpD, contain LysM domain [Colwellia chukchiensis]|uniref:Murein DD-endopeptidase MepM and murein hydrolase activator NlpD, contain LysM domain n=1 Tax=Colwellia chukchiensis TaxID=641665 RepID=A0A1H7MRE7_9GAMM|nr:M23 family metallopeptidase [Colwellia chukchiensis]SEL13408.1 Murein DD-endopeptidase MepM and murein hydrolase activator NlpD, contain LysM domain [Colwellia chukchiensis]